MKINLLSPSTAILFLFISFLQFGHAQGNEEMINQILADMVSAGELDASDIDEYKMTDHYASSNRIDHMYFIQTIDNIEIHNSVGGVHVLANGEILTKKIQFIKDTEGKRSGPVSPQLSAIEAVDAAAAAMGYSITQTLVIIATPGGPSQSTIISDGGISLDNIPVRLKYLLHNGQIRLTWEVTIYELSTDHWYNLRIDASTGALLDRDDMIDSCFEEFGDYNAHSDKDNKNEKKSTKSFSFPFAPDSYDVYPYPIESPNYGVQMTVNDPADLTASPFGWHDTNGAVGAEFTTTQGNNTHAYADRNDDNIPDPASSPDGTASLDFNFPVDFTMDPLVYQPASVTNLFYWSNVLHDVLYLYGFDEPAGNFQENNYGNGGLASDYVFSEAQDNADGFGNCNANFGTPPDGVNPRMQMFTCDNLFPEIDGSLDNGVIAHEYGHGVSNRLVGGPANVSCLNNVEQMGEGWSDFMGLIFSIEPGDLGTDARGIGTWLFGQPPNGPGIRPNPYSTDLVVNPTTYGDIGGLAIPHGVGYAWNTMLWEVVWGLIDVYGFNPDIYDGWTTGGNNLALQLVMDGMKLTPCNPGFVDGRDAILAADVALTGGANQCIIWAAFAKRGLGFSADQGSPASTVDGTQAFDVPGACGGLVVTPPTQNVCEGSSADYTVDVPAGFGGPVTLSAMGNPPGSIVSFSTNPVNSPGMSTMTVMTLPGNPGPYNIIVEGTDGAIMTSTQVELVVDMLNLTCYADTDGDGFGDPNNSAIFCDVCGPGFVTDNLDCDDTDPNRNLDCSEPIPTISEWGIIILSILFLIFGIVAVKQPKRVLA